MDVPFCDCVDKKCPYHPENHDKGCTPCIKKNLDRGEVPSCFWRKIDPDLSGLHRFTADAFAAFVLERSKP